MKTKRPKRLGMLLIGMMAMMTSCVQGDMYELYEDSDLNVSIVRQKQSKDGMNLMSCLGSGNYPLHVLSYFNTNGCLQRVLNAKFGTGNWTHAAAVAINNTYLQYSGSSDIRYQTEAERLYSQYFQNGVVSETLVESSFDNLASFILNYSDFGLYKTADCPNIGDIVITKSFSVWGGPNYIHASFITSCSGNTYCDSDGNLWSTEFIGYVYR